MMDSPAYTCGIPRQDANHVIFYCLLSRDRFALIGKSIYQENFLSFL